MGHARPNPGVGSSGAVVSPQREWARVMRPMEPMLLHALELAAAGLRVLPVHARAKSPPLIKGWRRAATSNGNQIIGLWERFPDANVGVALGQNLVVVESDSAAGDAALSDLAPPDTWTVRSARGRHLYFAGAAPTRKSALPGVEVRGRGSYMLGPGSVHPDGPAYRWERAPGDGVPLARFPDRLRDLLQLPREGRSPHHGRVLRLGERNSELFRLAASLRGVQGLPEETLLAALCAENDRRCRPPLHERELRDIAHSAARYPAGVPWVSDLRGFVNDPALDGNARHLLTVLAQYADAGGWCRPGIRTLAETMSRDKDTVLRAIKTLEAANRIEVRHARTGNRYRLLDGVGSPSLARGSQARADSPRGPHAEDTSGTRLAGCPVATGEMAVWVSEQRGAHLPMRFHP